MSNSKRFTLDEYDIKKWTRNTANFLMPLFTIILAGLIAGKTMEELSLVIYLWLLNILLDLSIKFTKDNS